MVLTVRHVGDGRTRDRALELQRQRRTDGFGLPHTGESRTRHQTAGRERARDSDVPGAPPPTVNQRRLVSFSRLSSSFGASAFTSLWVQRAM